MFAVNKTEAEMVYVNQVNFHTWPIVFDTNLHDKVCL